MKRLWLSFLLILFSLLAANLPEELLQMPLSPDEDILQGSLENGLKYYIIQNAKPANLAELRLFVDVGSIVEDEDQLGLAHFTEHMAFNGTTHFAKSEVVDYLASIGMGFANGLNAMTSYDFTMYQLKIPTDNQEQLEKGFLILSDMAHNVSFDPDELESERGVIIEEWRMGQNADSRVGDKIRAVTFAGSRYAERMPIGTYESLTTFGRDEIVRFYQDWYRPDLQSVVVIGDLPVAEAEALVKKYFAGIPPHPKPRPREIFTVPSHPEPRAVVATDPEYPYSTINASWTIEPSEFKTLGDFYGNLHRRLFFTMLNKRLEELSQSEDPPFSFAYGSSGSMLKGLSQTNLMAYTGEGKNLVALNVLLTEAERIRRHGFMPGEFERAKVSLLRSMEAEVERKSTMESGQLVWKLFGTLMNDATPVSPEDNLSLSQQFLPLVELSNVNSLIDELITQDNLTISYSAFEKEGLVHPSEEELLSVYAAVMEAEIEPYEDDEIDEPLLAEIPAPGKIKKHKVNAKTGVSQWTLSNGIKVYGKKTDFKADELLFSARSPGGYSRYPLDMMHDAQLLGGYLGTSGVADFDATQLNRLLTGKIARLNVDLNLYREGFSGSASVRDLETLFQLLYLTATRPRFDEKALNSYIARMQPWLANKDSDPQSAFSDSLNTYTHQHHPLHKPLQKEDLANLELSVMEEIFNERFGDFGDFDFIFVGNYDTALLEEYLCTYLATLPAKAKKEKPHDAGIRLFKGRSYIQFAKGQSESAYVSHLCTASLKATDNNKVALSAMLLVLNELLRENIREKMSGVYAIHAWQDYYKIPKNAYTISIWMSCSPERVEELNAGIFEIIADLKAGKFEDRFVQASREVLKKRYEENIYQNRYWLNNIINHVQDGAKADGFLKNPQRYEKISKKSITKMAKKYLVFDKNRLSVVMIPEKAVSTE